MAVLDTLPGVTVSINVDGQPLPEYKDDTEEETLDGPVAEYQTARTVCKYVEAISDKEFCIKMTLDAPFRMDCPSLEFACSIDGHRTHAPLIRKAAHSLRMRGDIVISPIERLHDGVRVEAPGRKDREFIKNFKFAKIETTSHDDKLESVKEDARGIKGAGEIIIKVFRASEPAAMENHQYGKLDGFEAKSVHEKALKGQATSHSTRLGPASGLVTKNYMTITKLDGDDYPLAIFKFRYRSREALKSLLILERTPSLDPESAPASPAPINIENLNPAQKSQLDRFLKGLVNGGRAASESPGRTIKRERDENESGSTSRKKRKSGEKVTIDLTADSDDDENIEPLT